MIYLVQFKDVGRDKVSWSVQLKTLSEGELYKEVKARGRLMSGDIDFDLNEKAKTGEIIVGGFRVVGTFSWETLP